LIASTATTKFIKAKLDETQPLDPEVWPPSQDY
jgi:hypothetical protein